MRIANYFTKFLFMAVFISLAFIPSQEVAFADFGASSCTGTVTFERLSDFTFKLSISDKNSPVDPVDLLSVSIVDDMANTPLLSSDYTITEINATTIEVEVDALSLTEGADDALQYTVTYQYMSCDSESATVYVATGTPEDPGGE